MLSRFNAYQLALELYRRCEELSAATHIRDQLLRASLSICLNLAEGSGKPTSREQRRFYAIALGSCRETQAILEIIRATDCLPLVDRVGACLYRLVHPR